MYLVMSCIVPTTRPAADRRSRCGAIAFGLVALLASATSVPARDGDAGDTSARSTKVPAPQPARPRPEEATRARLARIDAAKSWGYQLAGLKVEDAARSPYDLLVVDATTGLAADRHFRRDEVAALQRKPDGSRRLVVSYLSIGESEDYRPDYFTKEYLEEDAPDWLMAENKDWKGNRLIKFCSEGWQLTILGDETGRNVYNSIEPSPLYRLIELGFDGVYLDRVDVYQEIAKQCPDGARRMVDFVARLGAHARKKDPNFLVILQNAEPLLQHKKMVEAIDAVAKESLFYSWGRSGGGSANRDTVNLLNLAKNAGRAVFVVDYTNSRDKARIARQKNEELGFIPYAGPRKLDQLWLPGVNF